VLLFSLVVSGHIIQMMSVNQETGEVTYPELTTVFLVIGIVFLSNILMLVSLASLVCAAIKRFRAARLTAPPTTTAPGASAGAGAGAGASDGRRDSRAFAFATVIGRLRQLIPLRSSSEDVAAAGSNGGRRGLYAPLVGSEEADAAHTEMVSFEQQPQVQYQPAANAMLPHQYLQQQYPQQQYPQQQQQQHTAAVFGPGAPYAAVGSSAPPAAQVIYVPVSAQAMSNINML